MPALLILGLGCAPVFPCLLHETPANFGKEKSQSIMGLQMASGSIGALFIPPLFGRMASSFGYYIFPVFIGVLLITIIFMFELAVRKIDKAKLKDTGI
jgi:fucose permease